MMKNCKQTVWEFKKCLPLVDEIMEWAWELWNTLR